ncbi:tyrosine-protein phosphatase [Edaphobacter modestus]|uniref:protein-tyrosine-phosphatase n=1 Tax=Edaphobacter modestus TaxID=388466 RepID=A0A4Q7YPR6_9BACT|nr:CpsB/CapC family capsule biosynthesis tyrosine phosphatase [Edaphobacter modestus]RZU39677.1 protein-tyrosine phosphatase [Edaphobacter modestus]
MIDIHHHLLWDQDDGSSSLELSLEMAQMAADDGITHIACTPHANGYYDYNFEAISAKIAELQRLLQQRQIPITLGRGCDFHTSYDNILLAHNEPTRFSLNGGGYLLVEIPDHALPPTLGEVFYQMQIDGVIPILTHPERNLTLQKDMSRVKEWLRSGVLIQVTAGSVVGKMGKTAQRIAHELLAKRWVHFLATDAHNVTSRPPKLREAMELVADRYSSDYAHLLCVSNPLAAFMDKPMPPQMEPLDLYEDPTQKSWWQRLTGR